MKLKNVILVVLISVFTLTLFSFKNASKGILDTQDNLIINAVYDGAEDYGYNFIHVNSEGDERTIAFQIVAEGVLKRFDLKSEALVGKTFAVTYNVVVKSQKDGDGFDEEIETHTITNLEKVN